MVKFLIEKNFCEYPFLCKVIEHINEIDPNFLKIYDLNICALDHLTKAPQVGDNVIIILLSDEYDRTPTYLNDVKLIFKTGVSPRTASSKLIPFPLGYTKLFKTYPIKPIQDRSIDIFFAGQVITQDRYDMVQELKGLIKKYSQYKVFFNVSNGFLQGMPGDKYSRILHDSKICLCPAGTTMPESFRYYEAFNAGSVVFTRDYLYNTYLYEKAPIVRMHDWSQLAEAVNYFCVNPEIMQNYYTKTIKRQDEMYSERACAKLIIDKTHGFIDSRQ